MEPLNGDQEVLGEEDWNIPSCLIVKDIPKEVFESPVEKHEFEELFLCFGSASFTYLSSFGRVIVNYDNVASAALAKIQLHFTDYKDKELKVYFKEEAKQVGPKSLEIPETQKLFLISPPASPPVGWEQIQEPIPVVNYDLLSAIASLASAGQPQELVPPTNETPSIVVIGCEDPENMNGHHPLKVLPREQVQTHRPPIR